MKAHVDFGKAAPAKPALCAFNHSATCPLRGAMKAHVDFGKAAPAFAALTQA